MALATFDFEKPIEELESKLQELRENSEEIEDKDDQVKELEQQIDAARKEVYENLTPWQRVQIARHPARPHSLDYIRLLISDWKELHGDRAFGDDKAVRNATSWESPGCLWRPCRTHSEAAASSPSSSSTRAARM